MRPTPLRPLVPYALGVVVVAAALLVRWPLWPVLGSDIPYVTLFPALLIAAYFGGFWPGLLATGLGALGADYFVIEPRRSLGVNTTADVARLGLFLVAGVVMSWLCESLRRAVGRQEVATRLAVESEEQLRVTLTSIGDAVLVTDSKGTVTFLNPVAEALTGWRTKDAAGKPFATVFRIVNEYTRKPAEDPVGRVLREGKVVGLANHTVLIARDGKERPIEDSAAPVTDPAGILTGVVLVFRDVSENRAANRRVAESEERFAQFMRNLPGLAWVKDADGRYVFANASAEQAFGTRGEELIGKTDAGLFPHATAAQFRANDERALSAGGVQTVELLTHPDGSTHHSLVTKFPIPGPDGRPAFVGGMAIDVTEMRRAEETRQFLAETGEALAASLDYEVTLKAVAELVVPRLADWCSVYLTEHGELRRLAVAHVDPEKVAWAREVALRYPPRLDDSHGVGAVIRSGEPVLAAELTDAILATAARDEQHLAMLRQVGMRSAMIVPLGARARTLGAMTFVAAESGRRYTPDDLAVAVELARRAALAVDNARLYRESENTLNRLGVLVDASARLTGLLEPAEVRAAVLDLSHRLVAADAHAIWRHDAAAGDVPLAGSAGLSEGYLREEGRVRDAGTQMPERPIVAEDAAGAAALESRRTAYRAEGIASLLAVPLRIHGSVAGTLVFYYRTRRRFDDTTVRVAAALGDLAGAALGTAELYQRQSELRRRAEEADQAKDEFLALLGHELRNPLAPIRNAVQILELRGEDPAVLARARAVIDRQVSQLTRLVDELLDASRIARGKVRLSLTRLDLGLLVRTVVGDHAPGLESAGLRVETSTSDQPVWVRADEARVAQAVTNLLNNAAKFTPAGGRVSVRVAESAGEAVVSVADTGVGIPPDALPTLFQPFRQVDADPARTKGGLGLGLAVVRGLVELHGGRATAASEGLGRGSTFVIRLPLDATPGGAADAAPAPPARKDVAAKRVLIVEDREDTAESLRELLELKGFAVTVAFAGPEGVARAREFAPDAVVCDLGLPGMSGYDVARALRADPATAGVILVAVSGYAQEEDRRRAREAGFDSLLAKPADTEELIRLFSLPAV
ncbi:MAG TPA: PAS domain-containing protein [Gemmata sp.]|nr:PAS domain-containing protein [Gemmata sp.]